MLESHTIVHIFFNEFQYTRETIFNYKTFIRISMKIFYIAKSKSKQYFKFYDNPNYMFKIFFKFCNKIYIAVKLYFINKVKKT